MLPLAVQAALPKALVEKLALGESDDKIAAIAEIVASADESGLSFLQSLLNGEVQVVAEKNSVLLIRGGKAVDAVSGNEVSALPEGVEDVILNNRMRRELESAGFRLVSEGGFLRNPEDPRDTRVFSPKIPVDEFVLNFERPR